MQQDNSNPEPAGVYYQGFSKEKDIYIGVVIYESRYRSQSELKITICKYITQQTVGLL